jgi:hypothetical protein
MIRIYYNPTTGEIISGINASFANPFKQDPYIDIESTVRISEWLVDLDTKTLIPKT